MVQIDDAGSGSLVGGTLIGIIRVETGEYYSEIIPIKLYNEQNFKSKEYLTFTTEIIKRSIKRLKIDKNEQIQICQGYMFDDARNYLKENNYIFQSVKIDEPLQSIIEKSFEDYVISLGIPENYIKFTKYPLHFHRLLRWVYADYKKRSKICKTGWKSWQKYGNLSTEAYSDYIYISKFYCLKCGKKIEDNSPVKAITYFSNMNNTIYIHKSC